MASLEAAIKSCLEAPRIPNMDANHPLVSRAIYEAPIYIRGTDSSPSILSLAIPGKAPANTRLTENYHIYVDNTGYHYDLRLFRVNIHRGTRTIYTIHLYESNTKPHHYCTHVRYEPPTEREDFNSDPIIYTALGVPVMNPSREDIENSRIVRHPDGQIRKTLPDTSRTDKPHPSELDPRLQSALSHIMNDPLDHHPYSTLVAVHQSDYETAFSTWRAAFQYLTFLAWEERVLDDTEKPGPLQMYRAQKLDREPFIFKVPAPGVSFGMMPEPGFTLKPVDPINVKEWKANPLNLPGMHITLSNKGMVACRLDQMRREQREAEARQMNPLKRPFDSNPHLEQAAKVRNRNFMGLTLQTTAAPVGLGNAIALKPNTTYVSGTTNTNTANAPNDYGNGAAVRPHTAYASSTNDTGPEKVGATLKFAREVNRRHEYVPSTAPPQMNTFYPRPTTPANTGTTYVSGTNSTNTANFPNGHGNGAAMNNTTYVSGTNDMDREEVRATPKFSHEVSRNTSYVPNTAPPQMNSFYPRPTTPQMPNTAYVSGSSSLDTAHAPAGLGTTYGFGTLTPVVSSAPLPNTMTPKKAVTPTKTTHSKTTTPNTTPPKTIPPKAVNAQFENTRPANQEPEVSNMPGWWPV